MEGIAQHLENLAAKEQLREEVGEIEQSPLQVHGHGWFRTEETTPWMSQPVEVRTAWLARLSGSIVGSALEIQATTSPIWGAPIQLLAQSVMFAPEITPVGSALEVGK